MKSIMKGWLLGMIALATIMFKARAQFTDITINDGHVGYNQYGNDPRGLNEAGYVSANSVASKAWDLVAFGYDPTTHTLASAQGFDPINGVEGYRMGDVFFDTEGTFNRPNRPVAADGYYQYSGLGLKYAIHFTGSSKLGLNYDVYQLTPQSKFLTTYFNQNGESDPYQLVVDGNSTLIGSGFAAVSGGLTDATISSMFSTNVGNNGDNNYYVPLDVSFLAGQKFTAYLTEECGNDQLVGAAPAPEAGTTAAAIGIVAIVGGYSLHRRRKASNDSK